MSDTGGGHRASAQAIKAGFEIMYGKDYEVEIVDIWTKHTAWPINQVPKARAIPCTFLQRAQANGHLSCAVVVIALGTQATPDFCYFPQSYSFLVRNAWMWRLGFHMTNPRIVHVPIQTVNTLLCSRHLTEAFDQYDPDLVVRKLSCKPSCFSYSGWVRTLLPLHDEMCAP